MSRPLGLLTLLGLLGLATIQAGCLDECGRLRDSQCVGYHGVVASATAHGTWNHTAIRASLDDFYSVSVFEASAYGRGGGVEFDLRVDHRNATTIYIDVTLGAPGETEWMQLHEAEQKGETLWSERHAEADLFLQRLAEAGLVSDGMYTTRPAIDEH